MLLSTRPRKIPRCSKNREINSTVNCRSVEKCVLRTEVFYHYFSMQPRNMQCTQFFNGHAIDCMILCMYRTSFRKCPHAQLTAKSEVGRQRRENLNSSSSSLYDTLPQDLKRAVDLATEKGASSWLSTLPIQEHGFALHKAAFHDAVALRYGWIPSNVPR